MKFKLMFGAVCGSITAIGTVMTVLATELPMIPSHTAWQIIGLSLVCMGVWPMAAMCIREAKE